MYVWCLKSTLFLSGINWFSSSVICRGTDDLLGVMDRVHIVNSTLGKALGGAAGMQLYHFKYGLFFSHFREFQASNILAYMSLKSINTPLIRGLQYVYHIKLDYVVIFLCAWLYSQWKKDINRCWHGNSIVLLFLCFLRRLYSWSKASHWIT